MREQKKENNRGFKISQYVFATFMGLLAAKLAPSYISLPEGSQTFVLYDQLPSSFYPWWSQNETFLVWDKNHSILNKSPWVRYQEGPHGTWHTLTCDHFRCKGHGARAPIALEDGNYLFDCWGFEHGLPWIDNQEYVEPLLVNLLNKLQEELETSVVILSGHRCPAHHRFITKGKGSMSDRHLIAAAADFKVRGFEKSPHTVLSALEKAFNYLRPDLSTKFQSISDKEWKNMFCHIQWHPAGEFTSTDHPETEGFFELTLSHRIDQTPIKFLPKESYRLPLF